MGNNADKTRQVAQVVGERHTPKVDCCNTLTQFFQYLDMRAQLLKTPQTSKKNAGTTVSGANADAVQSAPASTESSALSRNDDDGQSQSDGDGSH